MGGQSPRGRAPRQRPNYEDCSCVGVSHLATPLLFSFATGSQRQAEELGPSNMHHSPARPVGGPFLPDSPHALHWRNWLPAAQSQGSVGVRGRR